MDDVDLTELDDWLGTLEELQMGLDRSNASCIPTSKPQHFNAALRTTRQPVTTSSSHVNQTFLDEPPSPRIFVPSPRGPSAHFNPVTVDMTSPMSSNSNSWQERLSPSHKPHESTSPRPYDWLDSNRPINMQKSDRNVKEATAERNLSSLLRDLEVVEERMKELEQENNIFTRRYSLASSPSSNPPNQPPCGVDTKPYPDFDHHIQSPSFSSVNQGQPITTATPCNGYISAQWAASVNRDPTPTGVLDPLNVPQTPTPPTSPQPPAPPAFLGAGDACLSPVNSPQPQTPSMSLLQQTEAGLWAVHNDGLSSSHSTTTGSMISACSTQPSPPLVTPPPPAAFRTDSGAHEAMIAAHGFKLAPIGDGSRMRHNLHHSVQPTNHKLNESSKSTINAPIQTAPHFIHPPPDAPLNHRSNHQSISPLSQPSVSIGLTHTASPSSSSSSPSGFSRPGMNGNAFNASNAFSYTPSPTEYRREVLVKANSLSGASNIDRLSSSLSPENTASDKSIPDRLSSDFSGLSTRHSMDQPTSKRLAVRIFRPDRTTKAIMIEESMTAGEVASLLIEKNFLRPSTNLAVVEKVPTLKVERVFEEHERLADCIMSWPDGSQNMIFFEERPDHFGFIESPKDWLGEEFVRVHRYNNSEAVQAMLANIGQAGLPEWRDYLYIRKPGDKTWSRRLCVLRSSGLYTPKKMKKNLQSTDLIRILLLDGPLQLYTTTGGWSRLRAPTPHGFAFKTYSAQDPASTHVFCFCATDQQALRHWICRLRVAKFGRQLYCDYQTALTRIQRQLSVRHGHPGANHNLNGSMSACIQRKSSFDCPPACRASPILAPAESATSLVLGSGIHKRPGLGGHSGGSLSITPVYGQPQQHGQQPSPSLVPYVGPMVDGLRYSNSIGHSHTVVNTSMVVVHNHQQPQYSMGGSAIGGSAYNGQYYPSMSSHQM